MSCSTCGSNAPCGCAGITTGRNCCTSPCGGNICGNANCCCSPSLPSSPLPFYACVPSCPESHMQRLTIQQFYADISIQSTWNIPACGEEATITVVGLKSINTGSYIWNEEFGYFEVTVFNETTGQITVLNHCNEGNAAVGTNVPACTLFTVTVPPCECPEDSQICVAVDFTAPDVDDCIDITLTTTQGLTVSDTIQIGSGFYFIQEIKPNNIITICNQGEGITPGTPVIAKDVNDNFQYCISIISTNPCARPAETEVVILGCGEDDVTVPLDGANDGWIATLLDPITNEAAYRPLGADTGDCTTLSANFNTVVGTTTYANVAVVSSAGFVEGDVLDIFGGAGNRFVITNIPNATHVDLEVNPSPGNVLFPIGSVVCLQSCCDTLQSEIDAMPFAGDSGTLFNGTPFTVGPVDNDSETTAPLGFVITNPSTTRFMKVHLIMKFLVSGVAGAALGDLSSTRFALDYTINGGGTIEGAHVGTTIATESDGGVSLLNDVEVVADYFVNLAGAATFSLFGVVQKISTGAAGSGDNDGIYTANGTTLTYSWIGIPGAVI